MTIRKNSTEWQTEREREAKAQRLHDALAEKARHKQARRQELAAQQTELETLLAKASDLLNNGERKASIIPRVARILFQLRAGLDYTAQDHVEHVKFRERVKRGK